MQSSTYHSVVKFGEGIMSVYCTCVSLLLLLAQLCVLGAARSAGSNAFRSDYTYWPEAEGWLKLHRVPLDWHTARVQCYHEGAVLASPLNAELQVAMTKMLEQTESSLPYVFSGVSATLSDGLFSSVEGIPIEQLFIKWSTDYLENRQHEDKKKQCLVYLNTTDELLDLLYYSCEEPLPYFCYRKLSVADELTDCGTVDREYKLDARTGHCYKFHKYGTTWTVAARICQAEGGYLVVVDSQTEADLLAELFAPHPKLLYSNYQDLASVGFQKWGNDNHWWTIHGKLLEENGYSRWSPGQPINLRDQVCGAIHRSGLLDNEWCDVPFAFICEKSPASLTRELSPPSPSLISDSAQVRKSIYDNEEN